MLCAGRALWVAFGLFFLFPLYAMADFSTRNLIAGGRTLQAWTNLVTDDALYQAIVISLLLAVFTVVAMLVILVPTMIWVRLRAPWAKGMVEFLCLLPLTIPALVIVVGLRNVYLWVTYFLGESALTLTFVYVVLVLPFAYRAIDAALSSIDLQTLAEAARSLGAGWTTTILRVRGAQHLVGNPVRRVHLDRRRARRVHHRVADRISDAAGADRGDRQERRPDVGGRLAGRAAVRLRAAAGPVAGDPGRRRTSSKE